jgi:2-haloacid dehalogenase
MAAFATMNVHPDVADGIHALKRLGLRLITLSNGSASIARTLLAREELDGQFEAMLSVDDAPAWKPARSAYDYAANFCGVPPADMLLVAVHPWDIHGAAQAGLRTGWLNRDDAVYPDYFEAPRHTFRTLSDLAAEIAIDTGPIPHG